MQDQYVERLTACFEKVFPDLPPNAIRAAAHDNLPAWDSLAQVTLVALIGEEFRFDIDFEEFEGATSFELLLGTLRERRALGS